MVVILTVGEATLMLLCIIDVVINRLNPTPKMKDKGEEKIFSKTICKTRKMYEYVLR